MINEKTSTAQISDCGRYRWTLTRKWDERPVLLVVMFNPSTADAKQDDATIALLCHVAAHNSYGGIVVVNGIPLRSSNPDAAVDMVNTWEERRDWHDRDILMRNIAIVQEKTAEAAAVLLAWGNLADRCSPWFDHVLEQITESLASETPICCLGRTVKGYPKHPMARGKHKVHKDEKLQLWGSK